MTWLKADLRTVPTLSFVFCFCFFFSLFTRVDWCALASFKIWWQRGRSVGRGLVLDLSWGASLNFYTDVWRNKNVPVLNDNLSQVALLGRVSCVLRLLLCPVDDRTVFLFDLFGWNETLWCCSDFSCVRNTRPLRMLSAKVLNRAADMNQ